jgi:hypothetical protein
MKEVPTQQHRDTLGRLAYNKVSFSEWASIHQIFRSVELYLV